MNMELFASIAPSIPASLNVVMTLVLCVIVYRIDRKVFELYLRFSLAPRCFDRHCDHRMMKPHNDE